MAILAWRRTDKTCLQAFTLGVQQFCRFVAAPQRPHGVRPGHLHRVHGRAGARGGGVRRAFASLSLAPSAVKTQCLRQRTLMFVWFVCGFIDRARFAAARVRKNRRCSNAVGGCCCRDRAGTSRRRPCAACCSSTSRSARTGTSRTRPSTASPSSSKPRLVPWAWVWLESFCLREPRRLAPMQIQGFAPFPFVRVPWRWTGTAGIGSRRQHRLGGACVGMHLAARRSAGGRRSPLPPLMTTPPPPTCTQCTPTCRLPVPPAP